MHTESLRNMQGAGPGQTFSIFVSLIYGTVCRQKWCLWCHLINSESHWCSQLKLFMILWVKSIQRFMMVHEDSVFFLADSSCQFCFSCGFVNFNHCAEWISCRCIVLYVLVCALAWNICSVSCCHFCWSLCYYYYWCCFVCWCVADFVFCSFFHFVLIHSILGKTAGLWPSHLVITSQDVRF
jgi:hypothetical protein